LDLLRAAALLAFGGFALRSGMRGSGQHSVFSRNPALPLAAQEWRNHLLDARRAKHVRVTELDERGAFRMLCESAR
jgi:hypothetical protein